MTAHARSGRRRRGYFPFLLPGIVLFSLIIVFPFLMNIVISFTTWTGVGAPEWVGIENYARLMGDSTFWKSFTNIAAMLVAMMLIPIVVGLILASILFDFVGRYAGDKTASRLRAGYYLPQVLPVAVAGVVWGWVLHPTYGALNQILDLIGLDGLARNWLGDPSTALLTVMAVMVWFQLGYPVVMFMAGLQRADPSLSEAAELDGAGWWQRFRFVTIFEIRPELFVVVLTTTIYTLKVFGPIFVLTRGGPGSTTNVPSYFAYQNFFERAAVGYGAAIATVLTLVILVFAILFLRFQNRGEAES